MSTSDTTGPVTIDDVRQALGDQDPTNTNAGALRRVIGRGSLSTIQKHLDALRSAAAAPAAEIDGEIPVAPRDLVQSIWASAWASAQARVQTELAKALGQSEGLRQALATAQRDAAAAQAEADQATNDLVQMQALSNAREIEVRTTLDELTRANLMQVSELEKDALQARQDAQEARQALELATARHAGDLAVLRGELDRQVSQLADLRAALQQRPAAPAPEGGDQR
jgi:Plasmid replication region DNA-binding N-term